MVHHDVHHMNSVDADDTHQVQATMIGAHQFPPSAHAQCTMHLRVVVKEQANDATRELLGIQPTVRQIARAARLACHRKTPLSIYLSIWSSTGLGDIRKQPTQHKMLNNSQTYLDVTDTISCHYLTYKQGPPAQH